MHLYLFALNILFSIKAEAYGGKLIKQSTSMSVKLEHFYLLYLEAHRSTSHSLFFCFVPILKN